MADQSYFHRHGPFPLAELAAIGEAELNDPTQGGLMIEDIAALESRQQGLS